MHSLTWRHHNFCTKCVERLQPTHTQFSFFCFWFDLDLTRVGVPTSSFYSERKVHSEKKESKTHLRIQAACVRVCVRACDVHLVPACLSSRQDINARMQIFVSQPCCGIDAARLSSYTHAATGRVVSAQQQRVLLLSAFGRAFAVCLCFVLRSTPCVL